MTRGGKRQGAGRKPGPIKNVHRNVLKQVRWTPAEWAVVSQAARSSNETPSEFQRKATLERAEKEKGE